MYDLEAKAPVKSGAWLYAGEVPCEVRIVRHNVLYGSGDYADPPDISDDQEVECFYILYSTPVGVPKWVGGGATRSIQAAIEVAEAKLPPPVVWHD